MNFLYLFHSGFCYFIPNKGIDINSSWQNNFVLFNELFYFFIVTVTTACIIKLTPAANNFITSCINN